MKIGEVAKAASIGIDAVRFYEREVRRVARLLELDALRTRDQRCEMVHDLGWNEAVVS